MLLTFAGLLLERLARACGARRARPQRPDRVLAIALPLVVLAPWLDARRTLLPTSVLAVALPGLPAELRASAFDAHGTQLNDVVLQLAPWEREVRRAFGAGRLPFWSDTLDGGSNLWGNPQAGVLSPVALLARLLPWRYFLLAGLALKLTVAFTGAALLARRLGARAAAATLAGIAFALGGGLFSWALFPLSTTVAWVPWFGAALLRLLRRPSAPALTATAIAGAALILSGHPEVAFAGGLFACALAAHLRRRARGASRRAAAALLGCLLAAGLAAPGWLPFVLLLPDSQRLHERLAPASDPSSPTASASPLGTYAAELRPFLAAALDGNAFGRPYSGVATLWPVSMMPFSGRPAVLLALAGLTFGDRHRRRRTLLAALLALWIGLLLLAPRSTAPGLLAVPAMNRFLPVGDLALTLAAALGFDALARTARRCDRSAAMPVAIRIACTGALFASLSWMLAPCVATHAVLWLPAAGLALWAMLAPRGLPGSAWPLLLWTGVELLTWDRTLLPRGDARLFYPETPVLRKIAAVAGAGALPARRAVGQHMLLPASLLSVYGIGDIRPHNPLAPSSALRPLRVAFGFAPDPQRYFGSIGGLDHPLLSFLDVGAVVSNAALPAPARLERVRMDVSADASTVPDVLWREPDPVGRLFLAAGVDRVEAEDLEGWLQRMRDPRRVAVESVADAAAPAGATFDRGHGVRVLGWLPGDVTLAVESGDGRPRLLASSLPGPLGWRASDPSGATLEVLRVNGAYLGVRLPGGVEGVHLRFRPPGVLAGAAMAGGSLLVLAGAWGRRRPRRR